MLRYDIRPYKVSQVTQRGDDFAYSTITNKESMVIYPNN